MDKLSEEMTEEEMDMLARILRKVKCMGHGDVTITIENHHLRFIRESTSYEFPMTNMVKTIAK